MNLSQILTSQLKPETIARLSSMLRVDKTIMGKVLAAAGPVILALFAKTGSTAQGAASLHRMFDVNFSAGIPAGATPGEEAQDVQNLSSQGSGFLQSLLGGKGDMLGRAISSHTGVDSSLVSKLLPVIAGFAASLIGKQVKSQGLSTSGLQQLCASQKDSLLAAIPSGLKSNLSSMPGAGDILGVSSPKEYGRETRMPERPRSAAAMMLLLGILTLGALWWVASRDRDRSRSPQETRQIESERARFDFGGTTDRASFTLPNGYVLRDIPKSSAEGQLASYLSTPSAREQPRRFVLERVTIDSNGNLASADSAGQMDNVAAILKAYPQAHAAIASGNAERVAMLREELQNRGVPANRLAEEPSGDANRMENSLTISLR